MTLSARVVPVFCQRCRRVTAHGVTQDAVACCVYGCGTSRAADPALLAALLIVEQVSRCSWCGHSTPGTSDCPWCRAAQTAEVHGSPSDFDGLEVGW